MFETRSTAGPFKRIFSCMSKFPSLILVLSISSKQERENEKKRGGTCVSRTPSRPLDVGMNSRLQIKVASATIRTHLLHHKGMVACSLFWLKNPFLFWAPPPNVPVGYGDHREHFSPAEFQMFRVCPPLTLRPQREDSIFYHSASISLPSPLPSKKPVW